MGLTHRKKWLSRKTFLGEQGHPVKKAMARAGVPGSQHPAHGTARPHLLGSPEP